MQLHKQSNGNVKKVLRKSLPKLPASSILDSRSSTEPIQTQPAFPTLAQYKELALPQQQIRGFVRVPVHEHGLTERASHQDLLYVRNVPFKKAGPPLAGTLSTKALFEAKIRKDDQTRKQINKLSSLIT